LSPEDAKLVLRHYGETDEVRRQSIDILRDWAEKNPRIQKIRLDSNFLLRFLRSRLFSIPMTQELIERMIMLYEFESHGIKMFKNIDIKDKKLRNFNDRG
jgi:hypothetical protein